MNEIFDSSQQIIERGGQPIAVADGMRTYLTRVLTEPNNGRLQVSTFTTRPWGEVLPVFTKDLDVRLAKATELSDFTKILSGIVTRGIELVSGGVVSSQDVEEGGRRGLQRGGTWRDVSGAHYWNSNEFRKEQALVQAVLPEILKLSTTASIEHIGRVVTMSLPALFAWADLQGGLIPQSEIVETVKRLLDAEVKGSLTLVTFGCEPYEYEHNANTTTSHLRRSAFGNEESLQADAIRGSFRAVRRIVEPLMLSGVQPSYDFFTSWGTNWDLIQRQVMPDTINHYLQNENPEVMLAVLRNWRDIIYAIGMEEFAESGITLNMREMESEVVLPALQQLAVVLSACGMEMPEDMNEFYYNSQQWFADHAHQLHYLQVSMYHPQASLLHAFIANEHEWSQKHAYPSEIARLHQVGLLAFFELEQYTRIHELLNNADIGLGVEIDEALIMEIRAHNNHTNQTPLIWGRPPRFTADGQRGGVAHRQPWFYATQ